VRGKQTRDAALAEDVGTTTMGVDAIWVYTSPITDLLVASFIDVKLDTYVHRTGNLFFETTSSSEKKGNMLTTKAEEFLKYDPILGKLYHVPIFPLRNWYKRVGIGKKHHQQAQGYVSEGIAVSLAELDTICQGMLIEEVPKMAVKIDEVSHFNETA
jgi:hypothetical protein